MEEVEIIFVFEDFEVPFKCSKEETINDICQKYIPELGVDINSYLFYYKEHELNLELCFEYIADSYDKANKQIKIFVKEKENEKIINEENNLLRFEEYKKKYGDKIYKEYNCLDGFFKKLFHRRSAGGDSTHFRRKMRETAAKICHFA